MLGASPRRYFEHNKHINTYWGRSEVRYGEKNHSVRDREQFLACFIKYITSGHSVPGKYFEKLPLCSLIVA